jgi:hypothetical protein
MAYIGREPQIGNFQVCDDITVVNNQAAYTMQVGGVNVSPETANHMLVSLNGILQAPTTSYTVSGSTITFASNLVTGDVINFIQILGSVLDLGVPSDDTVSLAKLTATGTKNSTTFLRGDNTFNAPPAGGAWEFVSRAAIGGSDVASVVFTSLSTSGESYMFVWNGIDSTANSDEDFQMQVSTDNGSNYRTSGYLCGTHQWYSNGESDDYGVTNAFSLSENQAVSTVNDGNNGWLILHNMSSTLKTCVTGQSVTYGDSTNGIRMNSFGGFYTTAEDTDAVRLQFETGNITATTVGYISLYKQVIA